MRAPAVSFAKKLSAAMLAALLTFTLLPADAFAEGEGDAASASTEEAQEASSDRADEAAGASASEGGEPGEAVSAPLASALAGAPTAFVNADVALDGESVVGSFTVDGLTFAVTKGSNVELVGVSEAAGASPRRVVASRQGLSAPLALPDLGSTPAASEAEVDDSTFLLPESVAYNDTEYSVTSIGAYAFYLSGVTSVELPASVVDVDDRVFRSSDVASVEVAEGNPNYSSFDGALYDADQLSLLLIPEGKQGAALLPKTAESAAPSVFSHCPLVTQITVEEGSAAFASENGLLYDASLTTLLRVPAGATDITIREGCTTIAAGAMEACASLATINAPASVTSISPDVFTAIPTVSLLAASLVGAGESGTEGEPFMQGFDQINAMAALSVGDDALPEVDPSTIAVDALDGAAGCWEIMGFALSSSCRTHEANGPEPLGAVQAATIQQDDEGPLLFRVFSNADAGLTRTLWVPSSGEIQNNDLICIDHLNYVEKAMSHRDDTRRFSQKNVPQIELRNHIPTINGITPSQAKSYLHIYTASSGSGVQAHEYYGITSNMKGGVSFPTGVKTVRVVQGINSPSGSRGYKVDVLSSSGQTVTIDPDAAFCQIFLNDSGKSQVRWGSAHEPYGSPWYSEEVQPYATTTAPSPEPRAGYTFSHWNVDGRAVQIGETTPPINGNVQYLANWTANSITLTWDSQGGSVVADTTQTYSDMARVLLPNAPTKAGYTFAGWYTDASGGTQVTSDISLPTSSTTYYARWAANPITLTWNSNGGSAVDATTQTYSPTAKVALPANPTKAGYTFAGWWTAATGGVQVTSSTALPTANATYHAHWSLNPYEISYELNGGTVSGNPTTYDVTTTTFTLKNPTRTGYVFTGWSGTGLSGDANMTVAISQGSTGNRSYTAHWLPAISADIPLEVTAQVDLLGIEEQQEAAGYIESRCGEPLGVAAIELSPLSGATELFGAANVADVALEVLAAGSTAPDARFALDASASQAPATPAAFHMASYGTRVPISYRFDIPETLLPSLAETTKPKPVCSVAYTVALA